MLWGDCLFLLFLFTDLGRFRAQEMDELSGALENQLSGLIGHSDVGNLLLDHFVYGRPWQGQFFVASPSWDQLVVILVK